jgi:KRAB domain-containing zinc finger protein
MNQAPNFVSHMMKPMRMDMAPPPLNPCATGTCCGNSCTFDCLCHLIDSDSKGIDVDDIYQVLGRDVLKSSVLDDIDLYLECDDDNVYTKAMPPKPGMESTKPKNNSQEPFKFKFSFPTNTTPPVSDSKKSFVCEFCSQSFIKDHLLKNHQAKSHNVKDLFPCPQCAYRGQQHAHLQKHIKRMHKKSSQSDESSNNLAQNIAVVPPKSTDEPSEQPSMLPVSNTTETLQQCNAATDLKPQENWPSPSSNDTPNLACIQSTGNLPVPQNNDGQGNVNKGQIPVKTDAFPHLSQQLESQEKKTPIPFNRQQSTPSRNFRTEPSPGPRSVPECSPRPGSRQSGHESSSDFSILDISNNTFKAAETATFLPGESLLAQLEGHDIYGSPKVDQVPFAVPSPHNLPVPPPSSAQVANQNNPVAQMMNFGSPGMDPGKLHDRPPVMNRAQTFPPSGNLPPGTNTVNVNQTFSVASSPTYPPRIIPTPPEVSEQKRRKVSPIPHASGRNSASSVSASSQGFASPSPTSCVPRIAPTPPDFSRPQMSPMSQCSSQHSSPTFGHVNQSFMSPSPPVSQPRVVPTPPDGVRHQMSPTTQRGNQYQAMNAAGRSPSFPAQSPPACFPKAPPAPSPTGAGGNPMLPQPLQQPHPTGLPRNMPPQLDPNRSQMAQVNPEQFPSNRPPIQAQNIMGQQQLHNPNAAQLNPGQQFYPQNVPGFQGQLFSISNQPPRYPYSGPRYPAQVSFTGQGQNVINANAQRSGPGPSLYPAPIGPQTPGINQSFVHTSGPDPGFPQQMQSQMYRPRQQQPIQRFSYQVQRHPYRALYDGSGQFQGMGQPQGNIMQAFPHKVAASHNTPQGVPGHPLQQVRPSMITQAQNQGPAVNTPGRSIGYISGQDQRFQQLQARSMEFQPPVFSSLEGNVQSEQIMKASGMMSPHVSQGNTANVAVHSNISRHLNSGLPQSQGNFVQAPQQYEGNIGGKFCGENKQSVRKNVLVKGSTSNSSMSSHIKLEGSGVLRVLPGHYGPHPLPQTGDSSVQDDGGSKFLMLQHEHVQSKAAGEGNKISMDINENPNMVQESWGKTCLSRRGGSKRNNANENNVSEEKHSADDKVNDKISWLLLHCGVTKTSDNKSGNSEICRLEIKTSEEEIGPVVHIMETQEVEGEMENILDDISRSESDATQSDSVLPVMSPQMNDEVFSHPSNNLDNSPPKLSRIDIPGNDSSEVKCEKCDFVCASKQLLKSHERHRHDPNRKIYKCDTCQVELKQKASYESHMAKHNGEMKHECHVCHKLFANRLSFNLHLKTHNIERPFKCAMELCNKAFRTRSDLNEHEKVVHGEKIHKCSYPGCEKGYTLEKDLRAHQVSHTIALKCSWPRCRKTFRDRFNLNNHYKTHTKEKPIECPHCDFRCIQRSSLESHMKNHHLGSA